MSSKKPRIYFIAQNGIKIELKDFGPASIYAQEQVRNELVKAFQVPKDMLFPTDKSKMEGTIEWKEKRQMT